MSKTHIFFPNRLSPQGFLNDLIASQIKSNNAPFPKLNEIIHGFDFSKKTENRLFFLYPGDHNKLFKEIEPKVPKGGVWDYLSDSYNEYKMRKYLNFLNNMSPLQQAALVPYIRLYVKQYKNSEFIRSKEIVFNRDYRIPNLAQSYNSGGGRGNAGIVSLQVDRDFQFYDQANRFTVQISYLFDSYDTFANGMQYDNLLGTGIASFQTDNFSLLGQDQGSGYLSLIKKGSENVDGGVLREYLHLEYGYKFPDTVSEEIVDAEDRLFFEEQEKKELRLSCIKHDYKFSETGEVSLSATYGAAPDIAIATRSEEKTNDVFLISNKGIISEIMDEPSESKYRNKTGEDNNLTIMQFLKSQLQLLKEKNDERKALSITFCGDENAKKISEIDEKIKEINVNIYSIKKELFNYVYLFFLRYFMTYDSLFNIRFKPRPYELEKRVLNPCDVVIRGGVQETTLYLDKISKKVDKEDQVFNYVFTTDYRQKIPEIIEKGITSTVNGYSTEVEEQKTSQIYKRFAGFTDKSGNNISDEQDILLPNLEQESYSCYQALQTFTLSRMTAQAALIRIGLKGKKCEEKTETGVIADPASYDETYGNISFFPLKALISAAIDFTLDEKEDRNNFPIICLGSVITESMGKRYFTSIGDLLVDVDYFKEWLFKSFIKIDKLEPTLDDFINAIFQTLVPGILSTGVGHYSKGNHGHITKRIYEVTKEVYENDELISKLVSPDPKEREAASIQLIKDAITPSKPSEVKRPLIIYYQDSHGRPEDTEQAKGLFLKNHGKRTFDKRQDYNDGIYHVLMGQNSGIVKEISFSYISDPNMNTLFAMKNPNHLASYMKYSYEATVNFVGNDLYFRKVNFFAIPRNQFNVSSTGISLNEPSKDPFGLTGYYQINKVSDKISMGEYTTTVTARNMFSPTVQEQKEKRCKEKKEIGDPNNGKGDGDKEPPILTYIELDIGEYIYDVFKDDASTAQIFNIRKSTEKDKETHKEAEKRQEKLTQQIELQESMQSELS